MLFKKVYQAFLQKKNGFHPDALRTRVLIPVLITALCELLLLVGVGIVSLFSVNILAAHTSDVMGKATAQLSSEALEKQLTENIRVRAQDMANLIDEKLNRIQNYTLLISWVTSDYFSNSSNYKTRQLPLLGEGDVFGGKGKTYLYLNKKYRTARAYRDAETVGNVSNILNQIHSLNNDIAASYIAGESGFFVISQIDQVSLEDYDALSRTWYTMTKQSNTLTWSEIYQDISGIGSLITCTAPIFDYSSGEKIFMGVAANDVWLSNFASIIDSASLEDGTTVFLLDNKGIKLFASDEAGENRALQTDAIIMENLLQSDNESLHNLAQHMLQRESGIVEINLETGRNYIAYYPLKTLDWSLGVVVEAKVISPALTKIYDDISAFALTARKETGKVLFISVLAFAVISITILVFRIRSVFQLSQRIADPISELAHEVEKTSSSNLTEEVSIRSQTAELKQLAKSFNFMKKRLREYIDNLAATTAEKERMSTELDVASKIQYSLLPKEVPYHPEVPNSFEIHAQMFSAREVGGDFYDYFFCTKNRFAVVIGDVSGKGVSAAMFMMTVKTLIKSHLQDGFSPEDAVTKLNMQLCENNPEGMFVTMWVGVLNPDDGKMEYVNAGHNSPLLKSASNHFQYITETSNDLVIGALEDTVYHKRELTLKSNSEFILYTDGITEAFDEDNRMYGEERLRNFFNAAASCPFSLKELLDRLYLDIKQFTLFIEQSDDITMLALRYFKETPS